LARDNASFHTVNFPATILGSGADIRLVDRIKCVNRLNYGGQKFSTSEKRGVFTDSALEAFTSDVWRWWLTATAPEGDDVSFSFPLFAAGVNADLADNLGNLVSRVTKFTVAKFDGLVPTAGEPGPAEVDVVSRACALVASCTEHLDAFRLRKAWGDIRALWSLGNEYFANQQPRNVLKTDPERAECITRTALNIVALTANVSAPVIPGTSTRILASLGLLDAERWPDANEVLAFPGGKAVTMSEVLFPKITADRVAALEDRFGIVGH
jgi:methionyl-tRNA synthetase